MKIKYSELEYNFWDVTYSYIGSTNEESRTLPTLQMARNVSKEDVFGPPVALETGWVDLRIWGRPEWRGSKCLGPARALRANFL